MAAQPCPPDLLSPTSLATLTLHTALSALSSQPSPYLSHFYLIHFLCVHSCPLTFKWMNFSLPFFFHCHSSLWTHTHKHRSKHLTGTFHRQTNQTNPCLCFTCKQLCTTTQTKQDLESWYYGDLHHQNHPRPLLSLQNCSPAAQEKWQTDLCAHLAGWVHVGRQQISTEGSGGGYYRPHHHLCCKVVLITRLIWQTLDGWQGSCTMLDKDYTVSVHTAGCI